MTSQQQERLNAIGEQLQTLSKEIDCKPTSNLFAATRISGTGENVLAANSEGLIYLASILTSLAAVRSPGQHYHFDEIGILSECQKPLVIKFEFAPWENENTT